MALPVFFVAVAAVEASIPRFRWLLLQLPFFLVPAIVAAVLSYRAELHPELATAFRPGSLQLARLRQYKKILGWSTLALPVLIVASIYFFACSCDNHPAILYVSFGLVLLVYAAYIGLAEFIKRGVALVASETARTRPHWSRARPKVADFKPFYSSHWGDARPPANEGWTASPQVEQVPSTSPNPAAQPLLSSAAVME